MHILITGGAGFIGSHLVELHLARGDQVHVVDDLSTGARANLAAHDDDPNLRFDKADILTWDRLDRVVGWADRIYHMAAVVGMFRVLREPVETTRVNVLGCERLLDAVARSGRRPQVVLPSSSSVYGAAKYEDLHERADLVASPGAPLLNYALSKLTNEVQGRAYAEQFNLPIVIARLFNTVGLRQSGLYGFVVPRFVQQAVAGTPITVFGDGTQTRSFCDVRDTVAILDALAATPAAHGQVVNVGNIQEIAIRDLAELIRDRTGSTSPLQFVPYEQAYGQSFAQIPQRRPILDKLDALTGYRHRWPLHETIDQLYEHYRLARPQPQPAPERTQPIAARARAMARSATASSAILALTAIGLLGVPAGAHAQQPATSRWALTPIYTHSSVSGDRGDWNQFELDLEYQAGPRVSLGANADWRERWGMDDTLYTGRVSVQATDALEWHASVTSTPDADFSPERIHATGLEWRPARRVSLLLDYRQLEFANGDLREWRPGAILWLSDSTWITARYSDGDAYGSTGYHASTLRLDHVFGGQQKLSVAYARGLDPERDPLLPGVLLTEADYVSIFYRRPLRPALDLILGAEYEDRERVYTRTGISVGLVVRF